MGCTPNHIHLLVKVGHEVLDFGRLTHAQRCAAVGVEINVHQDLARTVNIAVLEQRRLEGILDGLRHAVLTRAIARTDDGCTTIAQGRVHIIEVKVDDTLDSDQVTDAACSRRQRVIGLAERVSEVEVTVDLGQALVVNDEQCIYILAHLVGTGKCLENLLGTLKQEGDGHDTDGEHALLMGDASHNGCRTCTCTTTHTGGDENHLSVVVKELRNLGLALLSSPFGRLGDVAGAQAVGSVGA